ncbi:MAG: hypothetical protein ABI729_01660 [Chitinophagales bacterium]
MHLQEEILKEHLKKQTDKIAAWVCKDKVRFKELMHLFFHGEYRVVQRGAWIVKQVAVQKPEWIRPYLKKMFLYCRQPVHDAVKRNVMNIMQFQILPASLQGIAATICFDFLATPELPVAIKVFSMTVLYNITLQQPDLRHELKTVLEEQMEYSKPAFKSRGKKVLRQLTVDADPLST